MNSFNFNRFGKTLHWYLRINMKTLLIWTIGSAMGVFIAEMVMLSLNAFDNPHQMTERFASVASPILVIMVLVTVASITMGINKKGRREAFLMLPANNLEKFLALALYTSVICTLGIFLSMVVGDTLRMGYMWIRGFSHAEEFVYVSIFPHETIREVCHWWDSSLPQLIDKLTPHIYFSENTIVTTSYTIMRDLNSITVFIWIHSLFMMGGTLLRKYAFVASSVMLIFTTWLYAWFIGYFDLQTTEWHTIIKNGTSYDVCEAGIMDYVTTVLTTGLAVFNYWASFRIFKGFQLMTNKWTNYDILKR